MAPSYHRQKHHPLRPGRARRAVRRRPASLLAVASLVGGLVFAAGGQVALAPVAGAAGASGAQRAGAVTSVSVEGRGWGHGRGLSQWGAEGAARQGRSWQQIVRFYYPHTTLARAGGQVRVILMGDTTDDTIVDAARGLKATQLDTSMRAVRSWRLDTAKPRATRWRFTATADNSSTVIAWSSGGAWHTWRTVAGYAQFSGPARLTLRIPTGSASYRGVLRSVPQANDQGQRSTVNVVGLDTYLRGVVPQEVPASWHAAAVRAQAVAARTYATYERAHPSTWFDLCDTSACQVYGGARAEQAASNAAVKATAGQVLTRGGSPIYAQFSASNGGWTVAGLEGEPYLVAKQDPYDPWSGNPYRHWTAKVSDESIERAWPGVGNLTGVSVDRRDGHGQWGGRALSMTLTGSGGSVTVSGETFRSALGLRSTWFDLTVRR